VLPSVHQSPQPKRQINQFSHFCTAHGRVSMGMSFPVIIAPSNEWSGPHLIHASLGPAESITHISIGSAVFAQTTAERRYTLQWAAPFPLKITDSQGGSGLPSNTRFLGPIWTHNPNSISIGSAVFAGLTSMTARQIDRPWYSVYNNRPHLRLWRGQIKWHV